MKVVLTIAGSDSGGGAGLQADLRTFAAHRVHGASAVAAVTVRSSVAVSEWMAVEPRLVVAQIEAVATDMAVAATKTGMLGTAATVAAVSEAAGRLSLGPLVVDPVMAARTGERLLEPGAEQAYRALFPRAALLTPNLLEAEAFLGRPVRDLAAMRRAARDLRALGPAAVLVKGGALPGAPVDVFFDGERLEEILAPRVETPHVHGTGCTLSAAICARLAVGAPMLEAVRRAKAWLTEALRRSYAVGKGAGPPDHLHALTPGH